MELRLRSPNIPFSSLYKRHTERPRTPRPLSEIAEEHYKNKIDRIVKT